MRTFIKEPMVKKALIRITSLVILLYLIFSIGHFQQLNVIHQEQIKTYQRIVGSIVTKYPESESFVVHQILNDQDTTYQELGESVLNKFGYNLEMDMQADQQFNAYMMHFFNMSLCLLLVLLVINIAGIVWVLFKFLKCFNHISTYLEQFLKGDYTVPDNSLFEGVFYRIMNQLQMLGKSLELHIHKLNKEKEETKALVTDISHQVKTPIASLKLCHELLNEEELTESERSEFLERGSSSLLKLENLILSLVNISRLEVNMIHLKVKNNSIKETVTQAVESVYLKAEGKAIKVLLEDFEDRMVPHDTKWTEECIFNVLDNAVKYTKSGGTVNVTLSETINYVRIDIKDNGMGIPVSEFNNIFKRFYRLDSKEMKGIEGSGVGLYLSRKIVERQGGNMIVNSKVGEGSVFTLLLPKSQWAV